MTLPMFCLSAALLSTSALAEPTTQAKRNPASVEDLAEALTKFQPGSTQACIGNVNATDSTGSITLTCDGKSVFTESLRLADDEASERMQTLLMAKMKSSGYKLVSTFTHYPTARNTTRLTTFTTLYFSR